MQTQNVGLPCDKTESRNRPLRIIEVLYRLTVESHRKPEAGRLSKTAIRLLRP